MLVADTSTGEFWTYTGTVWTLAQPYFEQIGELLIGGGYNLDSNVLYEPLIITSADDVTAAQGYKMIFGGITITSSFVGEVVLPNLRYVSGPIICSPLDPAFGLTRLELPELTTCDGDIELWFPVGMTGLLLPKLKYAMKLNLIACMALTELDISELVRILPGGAGTHDYPAGTVIFGFCLLLETIVMPKLTYTHGLNLGQNPELTSIFSPVLSSINGHLYLTDNPKLTLVDLDVLETVTGDLVITDNTSLTPTSLGDPLVLPLLDSSDPHEPTVLTVTGNQQVGSGLTDVVITGPTGLATRLTAVGWMGALTCNTNDPLP